MTTGIHWTTPAPAAPLGISPSTITTYERLLLQDTSRTGTGLVGPLRRGADDFLSASALALVKNEVRSVLGTRCSTDTMRGELPWRMPYGSRLRLLRHRNNDLGTGDIAEAWAAEALQRWIPSLVIKRISATQRAQAGSTRKQVLVISVKYDVLSTVGSGTVLFADVSQEVVI